MFFIKFIHLSKVYLNNYLKVPISFLSKMLFAYFTYVIYSTYEVKMFIEMLWSKNRIFHNSHINVFSVLCEGGGVV